MTPPKLSIVIVSFNTRADLERCLESLMGSPPAIPHEIVVVDNASTDGSVEAVRRRWPAVRVVAQGRNAGFAAASNIGIRASSGTLLLLLNSDCVVPGGAIDRLVERLRAHPDAAVAGPRLVDGHRPDGAVVRPDDFTAGRSCGRKPWALPATVAWGRPCAGWIGRSRASSTWTGSAAPCLLVYRADAEAAGLLDERYFLYTEDVDFCAAIRARGRRVLFTPAATVTHLRGRSRATVPGAMNAAYRRSHLAFYEKHHPYWAPLLRIYLRLKGQAPD